MNWLKKGIMPLKPLLGFIKDKMLTPGCFLNIDETWGWVRIKFVGDGTNLDHIKFLHYILIFGT